MKPKPKQPIEHPLPLNAILTSAFGFSVFKVARYKENRKGVLTYRTRDVVEQESCDFTSIEVDKWLTVQSLPVSK